MKQIITTQYDAIIEHIQKELSKLRTARATPSLVEDITVEAYEGSLQTLKELASISVPEPRTLVIKPWDKHIIKQIEKALVVSALEFNPIVETELLRIQLPELTQETRERLVKKLKGILEENRIKIRAARDDVKRDIEKGTKSGAITEDDRFSQIEDLNAVTKEYNEKIDTLGEQKEKEIMTI